MADLSNLKIKDTYQLLLQADSSGNVQNLQGATPNPLIINGNLRYVDGNQQADYYLKSDGTGNASWAQVTVSGDLYISAATMNDTVLQLHTTSGTTIEVPVSYWSTDGSGNYSNSGLTGNVGIGTATPNKKLTVVGIISGSSIGATLALSAGTDLYLGGPSGPYTASTISAEETLTIKGRRVDNDYMILKKDSIDFHLDGSEAVRFVSSSTGATPNTGAFSFNTSGKDYDFKIIGEDKPIFQVTSSRSGIRIRDHLTIGPNDAISHTESVLWGLAVTGSSLFYAGGSDYANDHAIMAIGKISGTTDLTVDGDISAGGALSASTHLVAPHVYSNMITTTGGTTTDTLTIKAGILNMENEEGSMEYYSITSDQHTFLLNNNVVVTYDGEGANQGIHFTTHSGGEYYNFIIAGQDSTRMYETDSANLINRFRYHLGIGDAADIPADTMTAYGLAVTGSSIFHDGGSDHFNDHAIMAIGKISGSTDLSIGRDVYVTRNITVSGDSTTEGTIYSGSSKLENLFLTQSGLSGSSLVDKVGTITTNQFAVWSDSDKTLKSISNLRLQGSAVTGDIISGTTLSAATMYTSGDISVGGTMSAQTLYVSGDIGTDGDIVLDEDQRIYFEEDSGTWMEAVSENKFRIVVGGLQMFTLTEDDGGTSDDFASFGANTNVGIQLGNNTYPAAELTVDGTVSATTNIVADGNIIGRNGITGNTISATTQFTKDIYLPDNGQAIFGHGRDLSIIHNSVKSIITNTTGELLFENEATDADIRFKGDDDGDTITALTLDMSDAGTAIFNHDISLADNGQILLGNSSDLKIYHSGSHSIIQEAGTGNLLLKGGTVKIMGTSVSEDCAVFTENGSAELYFDNTKKLETSNTGVNITGNLSSSSAVSGATLQGVRTFPDPNLTDHSHMGDVIYLAPEDPVELSAGSLYCYTGGTWVAADADVPNLSKGLLAVAVGTTADEGMLIKGYYTCTYDVGTQSDVLYLSTTAGRVQNAAPSSSGQFVRIMGYAIDSSNGQMWFDPDKTWVELS